MNVLLIVIVVDHFQAKVWDATASADGFINFKHDNESELYS